MNRHSYRIPIMHRPLLILISLLFILDPGFVAAAKKMPPSIEQSAKVPFKYTGTKQTDKRFHHGGLRHAVGVHRYQALRANREHPPEIGSRAGWTYNHQPYLCFWNGQFFLQYLSNLYTEHLTPGRTLLMASRDGRHWSNPEIVFPEYALPEINYTHPDTGKTYHLPKGTKAVMHQRMGFYVTSDDRLLTLAFYSFSPITRIGPNNGQGLGRVVREVYRDGTFGPIYFIRYNRHAGWNESNTDFPFYVESPDKGFVDACKELLSNKLVTHQWWEEDRAKDGFYTFDLEEDIEPKAMSWLHRPDGVVLAVWKGALSALSADEGHSWTKFSHGTGFKPSNSKIWVQETEDSRYALVYTHSATERNRYPMVVMTSEDGRSFDDMLCLHGEVPPLRYAGWAKSKGPQYIRGIIEGNGNPPGDEMWNTFSVGKEDIWVTRTRVPITGLVDRQVNQDFEEIESEAALELWNFYIPRWAPIDVVAIPGRDNRVLRLEDEEPYDYASAERHFPPSERAVVEFSVNVREMGKDILEFELHGENDERALRLRFDVRQEGLNFDLGGVEPHPAAFKAGRWYDVKLAFDCAKGEYDVWLNGEKIRKGIELDVQTPTLERIVFRTGNWRSDVRQYFIEGEPGAPGLDSEDLAAAGEKVARSVFWIDNVRTSGE